MGFSQFEAYQLSWDGLLLSCTNPLLQATGDDMISPSWTSVCFLGAA